MELSPAGAGMAECEPVAISETDQLLAAACRLLLRAGGPVRFADLAAETGQDPPVVAALATAYQELGRMRCDGDVVLAAIGVSCVPGDFEVVLGGRRMWAWCAKTALGVCAALGAAAAVSCASPASGRRLEVRFQGGTPEPSDLAVFWPADQFRDSCSSAVDEYCPTLAIFETAGAARAWASGREIPGEVLTIDEAARRAAPMYREVLDKDRCPGSIADILRSETP